MSTYVIHLTSIIVIKKGKKKMRSKYESTLPYLYRHNPDLKVRSTEKKIYWIFLYWMTIFYEYPLFPKQWNWYAVYNFITNDSPITLYSLLPQCCTFAGEFGMSWKMLYNMQRSLILPWFYLLPLQMRFEAI